MRRAAFAAVLGSLFFVFSAEAQEIKLTGPLVGHSSCCSPRTHTVQAAAGGGVLVHPRGAASALAVARFDWRDAHWLWFGGSIASVTAPVDKGDVAWAFGPHVTLRSARWSIESAFDGFARLSPMLARREGERAFDLALALTGGASIRTRKAVSLELELGALFAGDFMPRALVTASLLFRM
jgi:hypothetical protein